MKNNVLFNQNKPLASDKVLKVTSLIYLKEALVNQEYEDCAELIQAAKGFGARQSEVRKVIIEYTLQGKAEYGKGNQPPPGRLRFLGGD